MYPLEQKVAPFVEANGLFKEARRILLAISGGADSTALLYAMRALVSQGAIDGSLLCAHVNHQLRGAASDKDEAFVVERARALGLPVVTETVDVNTFAKANRLSIETAGRQLRRAILTDMARAHGCGWIATGHQKNDNAETVVHRLRRGTGFRGLAGIWPCRQFGGKPRFARPLLCCTRAEIMAYLRAQNVEWREDHSNADVAHTRNAIRHRLLPGLQGRSSDSLIEELTDLAASARRLYKKVRAQAELAASRDARCGDDRTALDATSLASLPELVAVELLRGQLAQLGCGERDLTRHHYESVLKLARPGTSRGTLALPGGYTAKRDRKAVVLQRPGSPCPTETAVSCVQLNVPGTADFAGYSIEATILDGRNIDAAQIRRDKDPFREYLDFDRLEMPLVVRRRRPGDRFHPLGAAGKKKVGKFLTAAKVPEMTRKNVLIFADAKHIVWVCPIRVGEPMKVTEHTGRILMLSVTHARLPQTKPPA